MRMFEPQFPSRVLLNLKGAHLPMEPNGTAEWELSGVSVRITLSALQTDVFVEGKAGINDIILEWDASLPENSMVLGDAWERGYGDLQWMRIDPTRALPWYCLWHDGKSTSGVGVKTLGKSFAYWQVSVNRIRLILDVRSGSHPVQLGDRELHAATVVWIHDSKESPHRTTHDLCKKMATKPAIKVSHPVYGINDWYYAYGNNTAENILADTERASKFAHNQVNRPFSVIDAGWQPNRGAEGGPWDHGCPAFGDMGKLATQIHNAGCKPGIWVRPIYTRETVPSDWILQVEREDINKTLDPSIPEVLAKVTEDIYRLHTWGYQLIKHDFTTWDLCGNWGFEMKPRIFDPVGSPRSRSFADRSRTSAEIVVALYEAIRKGAGSSYVIGCNTISHLSAGIFEIQRTGDDTSGREWARTRKMGVNTLAFRSPQHNVFYQADPDCAGITTEIPWELNEKWLKIVSESGTPLFVSAQKKAMGAAQKEALVRAFDLASQPQPVCDPLDWLGTKTPEKWELRGKKESFEWGPEAEFIYGID